jgi:hypothetical protein
MTRRRGGKHDGQERQREREKQNNEKHTESGRARVTKSLMGLRFRWRKLATSI